MRPHCINEPDHAADVNGDSAGVATSGIRQGVGESVRPFEAGAWFVAELPSGSQDNGAAIVGRHRVRAVHDCAVGSAQRGPEATESRRRLAQKIVSQHSPGPSGT